MATQYEYRDIWGMISILTANDTIRIEGTFLNEDHDN